MTNIWSRPAGPFGFIMGLPKLFMISPKKGAETIVCLASARGIEDMSGEYFEKKRSDLARNLWDWSMYLAYQ